MRAFLAAAAVFCTLAPSLIAAEALEPAPLASAALTAGDPMIASAKGRFLAAWRTDAGTGRRIDGIAVDENGHRIAPAARTIVPDAVDLNAVIPAADHFLLAYGDPNSIVRFIRVAPDGTPLGDAGFPSFTNAQRVIASVDGKRILVVRYGLNEITGTVLDDAGVILARDLYLARSTSEFGGAVATANGFLFLTHSKDGVFARSIRSDATVDPNPLLLDASQPVWIRSSAATTDGKDLLLVWTPQFANQQPLKPVCVMISGGAVVKKFGIGDSSASVVPQKVVWTGSQYALVANVMALDFSSAAVAVMRFSQSGDAIDPSPVVVSDGVPRTFPGDAVWSGTTLMVTARELTAMGDRNLVIPVAIDSVRSTGDETLSILPARQNAIAAASDGVRSLAVWREASFEKHRIRAALLTDGIAGQPATLTTANGLIGEPVVAYGGGIYLAAWELSGHLYAARIAADGNPLDAAAIDAVSNGQRFGKLAIAWNGQSFLIAWAASADWRVQGVFVDGAGITTAPRYLTAPGDGGVNPALAWNGKRFLLAFGVTLFVDFIPEAVGEATRAIALDSTGAPIGQSIVIANDVVQPLVASNGDGFLVVSFNGRIEGAWLDSSGATTGGPFFIANTDSAWVTGPIALAASGSAYTIAFQGNIAGTPNVPNVGPLRLNVGKFAPGATHMQPFRSMPSHPDRFGGSSVAIAADTHDPHVLFTDVPPDGTSRVMVQSIEAIPLAPGRSRAVGH